jgi:hypothetical protein
LHSLPLKDLAQLVRFNRRFNGVARKERSRGVHLEGQATIAPVPSSALSHHVSSLELVRYWHSFPPITRATLQQLRDLPHLTALQLSLVDNDDVGHFMQGLSLDNAAAALRAVLPTQLRSFSVVAGTRYDLMDEHTYRLASSFWAALGDMTQLTELSFRQNFESMYTRPDLAQLSHLRKLTFGPAGERGEHVESLKQLSQLRDLTLLDECPLRIRLLCQPPHALRLESLTLTSTRVDEETMRALLHLPTLTALEPHCIMPNAWPLLPQLPRLRRLSFFSPLKLFPEQLASSLCASLSRCSALDDLTLRFVKLMSEDRSSLTPEQEQAGWTALLSSMPNLRRLVVHGDPSDASLLLPHHLPLLEHLVLNC